MIYKKTKIGEFFVKEGIITETTLQRALDIAAKKNKKIGFVLEDMGVITGPELAAALACQHGCKVVGNIEKHSFPKTLLDIIPQESALTNMLFPLKINGRNLHLAMADPTKTRIINNIALNHNLTIVPVIATRSDIIAAINKHYLGLVTALHESRTILIADDCALSTVELVQKLSAHNYNVIVARDGIEAFKLALKERPQVIITVKEMPNLGGYHLLRSIKNVHETSNIPVILLTVSGSAEEEAEAFQSGFFDFLTKPVKNVTLIARIKRAIQAYDDSCQQEHISSSGEPENAEPEVYTFPDRRL